MGISPCYAAPEMILGIVVERARSACQHRIDAQAQDVFSLACFVFKQFTGQHLFTIEADSVDDWLADLCKQHWQWVSFSSLAHTRSS